MIVCCCRSISDKDFSDELSLFARLIQGDHKCGRCLEIQDVPHESRETHNPEGSTGRREKLGQSTGPSILIL